MGLQSALCKLYRLPSIRDRKRGQLLEHQPAKSRRLRLDSRLMRVLKRHGNICHQFLWKVTLSHEATDARTGAIVQTLRDCFISGAKYYLKLTVPIVAGNRIM